MLFARYYPKTGRFIAGRDGRVGLDDVFRTAYITRSLIPFLLDFSMTFSMKMLWDEKFLDVE